MKLDIFVSTAEVNDITTVIDLALRRYAEKQERFFVVEHPLPDGNVDRYSAWIVKPKAQVKGCPMRIQITLTRKEERLEKTNPESGLWKVIGR